MIDSIMRHKSWKFPAHKGISVVSKINDGLCMSVTSFHFPISLDCLVVGCQVPQLVGRANIPESPARAPGAKVELGIIVEGNFLEENPPVTM
jgi:hypothetical protein